jgi:hypothetical protein
MADDSMRLYGRRNVWHRSMDQLWFGWPHIAALGEGHTGDNQNKRNNEGPANAHDPSS